MREIKFRAWDKKTKTMRFVGAIEWSVNDLDKQKITRVKLAFYRRPFWRWRDAEDVVLMQHTGRKDKNKTEIFKNDIIEITALTGANWPSPGFIFDKTRVEVIWDDENALWSFNLDADWSEYYDKKDKRAMVAFRNHVRTLMFDGETGKVIGNICENPELLKDTK